MADVLQSGISHTYAGAELINELFYAPQENVPSLSELYSFIPVAGDKKNLYIPNTLSKILRKYTTCGFSAAGGTTTISDKTLTVEKIKANVEECVDTWDDTVFAELMKPGVNRDDLSGTLIDEIIRNQYTKALKSDIHRIIWFADANDADNDWKQFDGYITLLVDNSATLGSRFINADSTSFETGDALASNGAIGLFRQIWDAQTPVMRNLPASEKVFYVTNTVLDNYRTTLESQSNVAGQMLIEDGRTKFFFRGVEIMPVPEWDSNLADSTNPHYTGSGLSIGSNLIVYAAKDNMVFGSDVMDGSSEIKIRYADDDNEKMKVTTKFKLGCQIIHYDLIGGVAY